MIVCIGSRSESKLVSITSAFSKYPELWEKEENIEYLIVPQETRREEKGNVVDSFTGISCIPNGLSEIITGAKNRALRAYEYAIKTKRFMFLWSRIRIWNVSCI